GIFSDIEGVYSVFTDETRRHEADETLRRHAMFQDAVFKTVADAILVLDASRVIAQVNPGMERLFGYDRDELIGSETSILYMTQGDFEEQGRLRYNPLASEDIQPYVIQYRRKDGGVFWGETTAAPL